MADQRIKRQSHDEVYRQIAKKTGLTIAQVKSIFMALNEQAGEVLRKKGVFRVPGVCSISVKNKPAIRARKGINPFTGEEAVLKARPASRVISVRPLKAIEASLLAHSYTETSVGSGRSQADTVSPPEPVQKEVDGGVEYKVWFGTDRQPINEDKFGEAFGNRRGNKLVCGWCKVFVPSAHRFGSIGSFLRRLILREDNRVVLRRRKSYKSSVTFFRQIRSLVESLPQGERDGLVFIHGFNVSFDEAAVRAAQIGCDLKVTGPMGFYSWPSRGRVANYSADEATIESSEPYIQEFLSRFVRSTGCRRVHLLVHSMGNRGLLRIVQRIYQDKKDEVNFGQVFLCAPDVDRDTFRNLAAAYAAITDRTTLYINPEDIALGVSRWKHGGEPRAGLSPPVTVVSGIDTIEVGEFNLLELGHGYYAQAEAVLTDMFDLLVRNVAPGKRQRPRKPAGGAAVDYWRLV